MGIIQDLPTLRSALADWQARTDLAESVLNTFIDLAENEIVHGVYDLNGQVVVPALRAGAMEEANAAYPLTGEYSVLPDGFLGFRSIRLVANPKIKLDYISPSAFDSLYLSADSVGPPTVYTIIGGLLRLPPAASADDLVDIVYYKQPPNLVTNSTNWICTKYPNTYLYGALRHLAIYCGMDGKIAFFQGGFIGTLAGLHAAEKSVLFSGVPMVGRAIGVTPT